MSAPQANSESHQPRDRAWTFRYAPHLGYRVADTPLLRHTARGTTPCEQVERAAALGFAGVQYPWAASRPREERAELARALTTHGLASGCVVWASRESLQAPHWVRRDRSARETIRQSLQLAIEAASEVGSEVIAILGAGEDHSESSLENQLQAMAENLRWAGDMAADRGMVLGLEPMVALPDMVLRSCEDGVEMISRCSHPAVKLIFDTGHVHDVDTDVLAAMERAFDHVALVQFADQPGRVEPGAGTIDFSRIMRLLAERAYSGLIELEHGWRRESVEGELEGLDRLRSLDSGART